MVAVERTPGEAWQYSGGGYSIMQQAISEIDDQNFAESMFQHVLAPLQMNSSSFRNQLTEEQQLIAATEYRSNGNEVAGEWHIYPEMAAAGLWSNPRDLLQYAMEIQNILLHEQDGILRVATVTFMLTPGKNNWGLGPAISDNTFWHDGANAGFRALLVAWKPIPIAVVIMVNCDSGFIIQELLLAIAREYDLPDIKPVKRSIAPVDDAVLMRYTGKYINAANDVVQIKMLQGQLIIKIPKRETQLAFFPQSDTEFFEAKSGELLEFIVEDASLRGFRWSGQEWVRVQTAE